MAAFGVRFRERRQSRVGVYMRGWDIGLRSGARTYGWISHSAARYFDTGCNELIKRLSCLHYTFHDLSPYSYIGIPNY